MCKLTFAKEKPKHLCQVKHCRNRRGRASRLCSKCAMRQWRLNNPHKAAYSQVKESARKRRIPFCLSLDEFILIVLHTEYMDCKGRTRHCYHLDRINANRGYEWGNIQIITCTENVIKGNQERRAGYVAQRVAEQGIPVVPLNDESDEPDPF